MEITGPSTRIQVSVARLFGRAGFGCDLSTVLPHKGLFMSLLPGPFPGKLGSEVDQRLPHALGELRRRRHLLTGPRRLQSSLAPSSTMRRRLW